MRPRARTWAADSLSPSDADGDDESPEVEALEEKAGVMLWLLPLLPLLLLLPLLPLLRLLPRLRSTPRRSE